MFTVIVLGVPSKASIDLKKSCESASTIMLCKTARIFKKPGVWNKSLIWLSCDPNQEGVREISIEFDFFSA